MNILSFTEKREQQIYESVMQQQSSLLVKELLLAAEKLEANAAALREAATFMLEQAGQQAKQ